MSSLRDAVREDLRLRMTEKDSDGCDVGSPIATHPAPGSVEDDEFAEDGEEEHVVLDEEQLPDGPAEPFDWTLPSEPVEPSLPSQPVEPSPPSDPPKQPVEPSPPSPPKQPVEPSPPSPPKQPVGPSLSSDSGKQATPPAIRALETTEFEASEVEEDAKSEEPSLKKPAANTKEKKTKQTKQTMKRPSATKSAGSGIGQKKRPAAAVEREEATVEPAEKEKPGPRSIMDSWPWVEVPDGPHLRECKVGEDWKAGLPTKNACLDLECADFVFVAVSWARGWF